ncbi:MAG: hypothetical protein MJE66_15805, partial [Proteobacteria bacterium]|nr:hypothetical protein [Pseudomonadota bacterium]
MIVSNVRTIEQALFEAPPAEAAPDVPFATSLEEEIAPELAPEPPTDPATGDASAPAPETAPAPVTEIVAGPDPATAARAATVLAVAPPELAIAPSEAGAPTQSPPVEGAEAGRAPAAALLLRATT